MSLVIERHNQPKKGPKTFSVFQCVPNLNLSAICGFVKKTGCMVALSFFSPAVKRHAMLHEGGHVAGPQTRRPGQSGRGAAQAACRLCQGKVS